MVSVLLVCGYIGVLELGNLVVVFFFKVKIRFSIIGYNFMIFMYFKCGNMKEVMRVFWEMDVRDVVFYNILIVGFVVYGNVIEVIDFVLKMEKEDIKLDRLIFLGVLIVCSYRGLLEEGCKVFELINCLLVDYYVCMVEFLGRVG